jgi:hypothetical protein
MLLVLPQSRTPTPTHSPTQTLPQNSTPLPNWRALLRMRTPLPS